MTNERVFKIMSDVEFTNLKKDFIRKRCSLLGFSPFGFDFDTTKINGLFEENCDSLFYLKAENKLHDSLIDETYHILLHFCEELEENIFQCSICGYWYYVDYRGLIKDSICVKCFNEASEFKNV